MRRAAAALLALAACATPAAPVPEEPPLLFTRPRAWTPEQLNQDVVDCVDSAEAAVLGEPGLAGRPPGTARALLRERTVACMDQRGWRLGAGPTGGEKWAE
jgi:hypothetical protein